MSAIKQGPITLTFPASGGNTQTTALFATGGELSRAVVVMPNFTNSVTATFTLKNAESRALVSVTGIPKDATTVITPTVTKPTLENWTLELTLSGDPGGSGGNVDVTLYWVE